MDVHIYFGQGQLDKENGLSVRDWFPTEVDKLAYMRGYMGLELDREFINTYTLGDGESKGV